ncbi:MAG: hypothetical protein GX996_03700 [Firmicutes bacterium]|nr:hypothetical protein [Bacillota bacterium]
MSCPICKSINTGKVGHNTYYCSDCLLEFTENGGEVQIFYIDAEGSSFPLKDKETALKVAEACKNGNDLVQEEKLEELILKSETLER